MPTARILIVDDEADVRETLADSLRPVGYQVVAMDNAREAIASLGHQPADAVILDIAMPDVDGVHALQLFRTFHPSVPIIMVTANADVEVARDTLRMGAFDYIAKPYDLERLRAVVAAAVAHHGREGTMGGFRGSGGDP
jgi:DNA-binding NtrC family response regulator